jgi:DNA-binding LytR/AlgR family response regulator
MEGAESSAPFDLAFLDIQFPGEISGLELAHRLRTANEHMCIVFTTNYRDYALEGYKVNALRYLMKPVGEEQVFECLDIAWRQWRLLQNESILVPATDQVHHVVFRSICYLESRAHYVHLYLADQEQELRVRAKLSEFMKLLPGEEFVQCHRSFAVNLFYVQSISKTAIQLTDGTQIPVSRNYWEQALAAFGFLFQGGMHGTE